MFRESAKSDRMVLVAYVVALLLLLSCTIIAGTILKYYIGPNAAFLYAIIFVQWIFVTAFCAMLFYFVSNILLIFTHCDLRIGISVMALCVSILPIAFLASINFRLPYSGEFEGEAIVEYLLWRMEKSDNPVKTDEYKQLEAMLVSTRDEECRTAIERILKRIQKNK